jgi:hypothetical protein
MITFRKYLWRIWSATSQWLNVVFLFGHPNESISGRCYREPWPRAMALINKMFFWQVNHCKSAYNNDLKWAKAYIETER